MGWVSILDLLSSARFLMFPWTGALSDIFAWAIRRMKTKVRNWSGSVGSSVARRVNLFFVDEGLLVF